MPCAKDIAMTTPEHVADELSAMAGLANDLLDRRAVPAESQDHGIAILLLRTGKGGMSAHSLEQCMAGFARLKRETAQQVIEFQRKQHKAGTPVAG